MNPAEALSRAAIGAVRRGELDRAHELLGRARDWEPRSGHVIEAGALIALTERRWEAAERGFRLAMESGIYSSRVYTGLGLALLEQGVQQHALQSFEYALSLVAPEDCPWSRRARCELEYASNFRGSVSRRGSGSREGAFRRAS